MTYDDKIEIRVGDLAHLLLCSFRYSLGRQTYITGMCAHWLLTWWYLLPADWQRQIHSDIETAIRANQAGDDCDIAEWKKVLLLSVRETDQAALARIPNMNQIPGAKFAGWRTRRGKTENSSLKN